MKICSLFVSIKQFFCWRIWCKVIIKPSGSMSLRRCLKDWRYSLNIRVAPRRTGKKKEERIYLVPWKRTKKFSRYASSILSSWHYNNGEKVGPKLQTDLIKIFTESTMSSWWMESNFQKKGLRSLALNLQWCSRDHRNKSQNLRRTITT